MSTFVRLLLLQCVAACCLCLPCVRHGPERATYPITSAHLNTHDHSTQDKQNKQNLSTFTYLSPKTLPSTGRDCQACQPGRSTEGTQGRPLRISKARREQEQEQQRLMADTGTAATKKAFRLLTVNGDQQEYICPLHLETGRDTSSM